MSLETCVIKARDAGKLTDEQAADLIEQKDLDPQEVIDSAQIEAYIKRRQNGMQIMKTAEALANARKFDGPLNKGILTLITRHVGADGVNNINAVSRTVIGVFDAKMAKMLNQYRGKMFGMGHDKEGTRNLVSSLFGKKGKDKDADEFAAALSEALEYLRLRFNKAGGAIPKLDSWRLPQVHDPFLVAGKFKNEAERLANKQKWVDFVSGLKIENLKNKDGLPLDEVQQREVLGEMWESIVTQGMNKQSPGQYRGIGKVANRGQHHRILHFQDAESWLKYQEAFGSGDILDMLHSHVKNMADDIAAMEILGPNPGLTFNYLSDVARKEGVGETALTQLDTIFKTQTGIGNSGTSMKMAAAGSSIRSAATFLFLGKAFLSALTDPVVLSAVSRFNGIPPVKAMHRMMKNMNPKNSEDRLFAVQIGLVADNWKQAAIGANRYAEVMGRGWMQKLADVEMRATLMSSWTEANRQAFGMEFMAYTAKQMKTDFDKLPEYYLATLKRYGLDANDWANIQKSETNELKEVKFADGNKILEVDEVTHRKFMSMVIDEGSLAITAPDARTRATMLAGTRRGTIAGEIMSTATLFKSFPVTMMNTHMARAWTYGTKKQRAEYSLILGAGLWIGGAVAMQAKELAAGKEPRPMDDKKFWGAALLQGGGLGLFGDLLFSDHNRFNGGVAATALGPAGGFIDDTLSLTMGNLQQAYNDEDTDAAVELFDYAARYATPKPWTLGAALIMDRLSDQIELAIDPSYARKQREMMYRQKEDYGNDYWWKKGETKPEFLK